MSGARPGTGSRQGERRRNLCRGFTLMEVTISMLILAVTLTALLEAQTVSLHNATRTRGVTIASLLARSKMIDIEQHLFDEGFTMGEETDEGDFEEEGHGDFKWEYRIAELEMDLSSLSALCGGFADDEEGASAGDCESMISGFAGPFESLTDELGRSMRMVELTVTWPNGRGKESMEVRALVTREDFAMQPALGGDLQFPTDPSNPPREGLK